MHFRITDTRSGRSIKTFELKDYPSDEYLGSIKLRLAIKKNVPIDAMEISQYTPWKKKTRTNDGQSTDK